MKPKQKRGAKTASPNPAPAAAGSPKRRWLFRLAAVLLLPAALLLLAEGVLRLAGYGYPTSFFRETVNGAGNTILVENDKFGWRFFPRQMARSPSRLIMETPKPPGRFRVFLFGESAALGDPKPAYGAGRYLEVLLEERYPDQDFEVICVAMTAINSHAIREIAQDCAGRKGDLWVIYMGNNEMVGPFGANPLYGQKAPPLGAIRASLALRETRLGQLLHNLAAKWRRGGEAPGEWEGMSMFLDHKIHPNDPAKETVYSHFRENLEDIVQLGLDSGASVLISTVASNLRDSAPFASAHTPDLTEAQMEKWRELYERGRALIRTNDYEQASQVLAEAAEINPLHAEMHFARGEAEWFFAKFSEAKEFFIKARDLDALPFRTDSRLNKITAETAAAFDPARVRFLDAPAAFSRQAPDGIPGQDIFFDHVHFTFEGNYLLARFLAPEIEALLPAEITQGAEPEWASAEECNRRLGLTIWNRRAAYENMLQRLLQPPFTGQLNHRARSEALAAKVIEVRDAATSEAAAEANQIYLDAIAEWPRDFRLKENYAEFLEATGNIAAALEQWRAADAIVPGHWTAEFQMGRLLSLLGEYEEARQHLRAALERQPKLVEAHIEIGETFFKEGKPAQAMAEYKAAEAMRPDDARIHYHMANALAADGKRAEALEKLREAIRLRPSYWEAHYLLGVELATDQKIAEALPHFAEVARLRPEYAPGRFNLAVALAKAGRIAGAVQEFEETLRLEPEHAAAREYLDQLKGLIEKAAAAQREKAESSEPPPQE